MAEYKLVDVKAAAQNLEIEYRGRKVYKDIANLDYELHDVADCLCKLTPDEFRKTHYYPDRAPDDEYICKYRKGNGEDAIVDELYVKFSLMEGTLVVDLGSFHLPLY